MTYCHTTTGLILSIDDFPMVNDQGISSCTLAFCPAVFARESSSSVRQEELEEIVAISSVIFHYLRCMDPLTMSSPLTPLALDQALSTNASL